MAPTRLSTQSAPLASALLAHAGSLYPACAGVPRGVSVLAAGLDVVAGFGYGRGGAPSTDEMPGNVSFSADERASAGDFRKESKTQLPKLDVSGAGSAGPSAMIRGFEVWALRVGLT
eukprot:6305348-Amphidinium_carterae.1